ncbi:MAG TPA: CHAD domain-containing protein [Caulobacteraceae bacterium]
MSDTHGAGAGAGREVELKLAIGSDAARSAADRELGRAPARSVETIYYDTPRRRLHSAGYSLRLRRDGEKWSQSVKSADGFNRFEQDHPLRGAMPDFSLLEGTPIASLVDVADGLSPMFVTRVQRRSRRRDADGSRIEYSLDEGEVIAADRSWPILELELELKAGAPGALFDQGRRLARDEAFVPAFMSKADRGYALVDGILGEPVKFGAHKLDDRMSAAAAFQTLARRCLRQLSLNADLIGSGWRLEALHQARTALRRLRVAMKLFEPLLAKPRTEAIEAELKWLTGELADARNLDVLVLETFQPVADKLADRAAAAAFGKALLAAQERGHERAREALASPRFRLMLLDAARWVEGCGEPAEPALIARAQGAFAADFAARALAARRKALCKRIEDLDWGDPFARHKVRIAAKKMRYASEFFLGLGPKSRSGRYRPFVEALSEMQDKLGRLNDLSVAETMILHTLEAALDTRDGAQRIGYAAGVVMGRNLAHSDKLARSARRASRAFADTPVWW